MAGQKSVVVLLVLVALLLGVNLVVKIVESVPDAQADVVEGKNIFSTHSTDGRTIYLWGYTQAGSFNDATVKGFYYGTITPSGFEKP